MASGGPYLQSLAQARSIAWGKSWQWDSRFTDAPAPFNTWFPATEARRNISEVKGREFSGFGDAHEIPQASGMRNFTVTFHDDDRGTLLKWFDDWIELYMLGRGQGTARLANIVRNCDLVLCDSMHQPIRPWRLQVYPYGSLTYAANSESRFLSYMLSFHVAGVVNPEA